MSDSSLFDLNALGDTPSAAAPPIETGSAERQTPSTLGQSQSLYRKYRPQSFRTDEFFGQQHIVHTLRNAIALDRIAHAYLFCGPRGTGKTSTARLMAKAVNCLDPDPYNRPCNACDACVAITRNATTDVIEIDAASNRGIDDIRDLRERVKYAPTQLRTKFYIIDEAHQITGAAANAFLKTLEEPPAHTRFVLATTDPEELLQTIVSRCQRFDFRRIDLESMRACLTRVASLESIEIDDDALTAIARFATGSLRDALGLLDQVAVYRDGDGAGEGRVTGETVRTVLGVSRNDRIEALVKALGARDAVGGLATIAEAVDDGDDIRQLGRQLVAYLRMLMLERAGGSSDADDTAKALVATFSLSALGELVRAFADIDYRVRHAPFPQLPLELAVVEAATSSTTSGSPDVGSTAPAPPENRHEGEFRSAGRDAFDDSERPSEPRTTLRDRVRGNTSRPPARIVADPPSAHPAPEPPSRADTGARPPDAQPSTIEPGPVHARPTAESRPDASDGGLSMDRLVDLWAKIRADVKSVNRRIEALLQQIDPYSVNGTQVKLVSAYEFHRNRVNSDEARKVIEDVISRLVGQQVQVHCITREEANASGPVASPRRVEPGPEPEPEPAVAQPSAPADPSTIDRDAGSSSSTDADEQRIQAAKNIFDAEEVDQ